MESHERWGRFAKVIWETLKGRLLKWRSASSRIPPLMCKDWRFGGQEYLGSALQLSGAEQRGRRKLSRSER